MVTLDELRKVMPRLPASKAAELLEPLQAAMAEFDISTYWREAAFLAQLAHESVELRYWTELGRREYFERYEGRVDLGNVHRGDGWRYRGRGPIQLTGRANYGKYGRLLGVDLLANPDMAASPQIGFRVAGLYWRERRLNDLADQGDDMNAFRALTKRINGGYNGVGARVTYWRRALLVLSTDDDNDRSPCGLIVDGQDVSEDASSHLVRGRCVAALRIVADAAGWRIVQAEAGRAVIRQRSGAQCHAAFTVNNGIGWVAVGDLPGEVSWNAKTKTASLNTEES